MRTMKKLKLDVEQLNVESFQAEAPARERQGTVQAHAARTLPLDQCFFSVFPTCGIYC
jgi:hypothetical protein